MQITNWINKINSKRSYLNREKPKKDDIACVATRVKHQVLNVRVTSILNCRSDWKIYDKIILHMNVSLK